MAVCCVRTGCSISVLGRWEQVGGGERGRVEEWGEGIIGVDGGDSSGI